MMRSVCYSFGPHGAGDIRRRTEEGSLGHGRRGMAPSIPCACSTSRICQVFAELCRILHGTTVFSDAYIAMLKDSTSLNLVVMLWWYMAALRSPYLSQPPCDVLVICTLRWYFVLPTFITFAGVLEAVLSARVGRPCSNLNLLHVPRFQFKHMAEIWGKRVGSVNSFHQLIYAQLNMFMMSCFFSRNYYQWKRIHMLQKRCTLEENRSAYFSTLGDRSKLLFRYHNRLFRILPMQWRTYFRVMTDNGYCKLVLMVGRKICEEHKGLEDAGASSAPSARSSGWPIICGARASYGSLCKSQPIAWRKRCVLHKGQRVCCASIPSTKQ